MRILISAESFLPRSNGVSNTVARTTTHMSNLGHEVLVIAPGDGPEEFEGQQIIRVPAISLHSKITVDVAMVRSMQLRKIAHEFAPDIVHLASPYLLGAQVLKVAKKLEIPSVSVYQTDVTGFANFYGLNFVRSIAERRLRKIHMNSDLNLAPSTSSINYLRGIGVSNVDLWGRGVDHEMFKPTRRSRALRRRWGILPQDFVIGYVGRLAPEKQVENLRALRDLSDLFGPRLKIVVIGDGPSRIKLKSLLPSAHFTGHLSGENLATAMASLDLLVTTGENETFCQVIQEAMASALPVVAPRVGGPIDLIESGFNGLLYQPGDLVGLRRAVIKLAVAPDLAREMGQQGLTSVADRSWERVCDQLLGHYHRAIALHQRVQAA